MAPKMWEQQLLDSNFFFRLIFVGHSYIFLPIVYTAIDVMRSETTGHQERKAHGQASHGSLISKQSTPRTDR